MKASQGPALVSISGRRMRSSCSLEPRCGRVPLQSQTQSRLNPAQGSWEGCAGEMDKREMQPAGVPSGGEGRSVADLDGGLATNGHRTAVRERSPVQDLFRPGQVGSRSGYWLYALTLSCINRGNSPCPGDRRGKTTQLLSAGRGVLTHPATQYSCAVEQQVPFRASVVQ